MQNAAGPGRERLGGKVNDRMIASGIAPRFYVANGFGDDTSTIDVKSRKAIESIPIGRIPWGIVIDD
jgi:YVTN family beta-propeller protein